MSKRILCVLGSKPFYGKERSNIEVYHLLKDQEDCQLKVVMNKDASGELKRYLKPFDIIPSKFPDRNAKKFKYFKYVKAGLQLNLKIILTIVKFRPHYIFLNDERVFYDACFPIYFFSNKVVYRIGDKPAYPKLNNYKVNSWIWKNIVLKKTDTFVYISDFIKHKVEATGRSTSGDFVIYNYPPRRKETEENVTIKYSDFDGLTFGYLGQINSEKGVHLFVDSAVKLLNENNELLFYIAGDLNYSKEYAEKLVEKVKYNHLEDRIVFLGNIDDIRTFFKNIDVLVTPTLTEEPLGNVIVEAKKYATPSIIFNSGGMPELIAHGTNGFVCESSTSSGIIKAIEYYIQNEQLIELHGKNAEASIVQLKIDYPNYKKKWLKVFSA